MIDPFSYWTRMMAAGAGLAETGVRMAETISAAGAVIDTRSGMMRTAMHAPARGDHAELGRMVPEKLQAFSQSGAAISDAWAAMGSAWLREAEHLTAMALRGRAPTPGEMSGLADRAAAYALGAVEASAALGGKALAPVHRTATSNARRLKRKSAKAGG